MTPFSNKSWKEISSAEIILVENYSISWKGGCSVKGLLGLHSSSKTTQRQNQKKPIQHKGLWKWKQLYWGKGKIVVPTTGPLKIYQTHYQQAVSGSVCVMGNAFTLVWNPMMIMDLHRFALSGLFCLGFSQQSTK